MHSNDDKKRILWVSGIFIRSTQVVEDHCRQREDNALARLLSRLCMLFARDSRWQDALFYPLFCDELEEFPLSLVVLTTHLYSKKLKGRTSYTILNIIRCTRASLLCCVVLYLYVYSYRRDISEAQETKATHSCPLQTPIEC